MLRKQALEPLARGGARGHDEQGAAPGVGRARAPVAARGGARAAGVDDDARHWARASARTPEHLPGDAEYEQHEDERRIERTGGAKLLAKVHRRKRR